MLDVVSNGCLSTRKKTTNQKMHASDKWQATTQLIGPFHIPLTIGQASDSTLSMFVCALRDAGDGAIAFVLAGAMLVQAVIYQVPLWIARYQGWLKISLLVRMEGSSTNEFLNLLCTPSSA